MVKFGCTLTTRIMKIPSNYALRLPVSLKKFPEAAAREDGSTLNQFSVSVVAEKALSGCEYGFERLPAESSNGKQRDSQTEH